MHKQGLQYGYHTWAPPPSISWIPAACVICGTNITVVDTTPIEMADYVCTSCTTAISAAAVANPSSTTPVTSEEFEKELDLILCNEELEFEDMKDWELVGDIIWNKCECGSDTAGDKYHSRWCPKFTEPMGDK
jgi:hypothetical protein